MDCWAIGILAFECLYDYAPFDGADMQDTYDAIYDYHGGLRLKFDDAEKHVSQDAKDFIVACLDVNPATRLTAKQMLTHPWVSKYARYIRCSCSTSESSVSACSDSYNTTVASSS